MSSRVSILGQLYQLVTSAVALIDSLLSIKIIIIFIMIYGCYLSTWNTWVICFTGVTLFVFIFIREIQKPKSNLTEVIKSIATSVAAYFSRNDNKE